MTTSFDIFLSQYEATGSEKADGYSADAFTGLDETEKDKVFEMLKTELPYSSEWLFRVDPQKAEPVVRALEKDLRGKDLVHVYLLQQQLVNFTGDLMYQDHMIEDYPHYADRIKPLVVDAVSRTPATDAAIGHFKNVILTEANSSAVARAARHLLKAVSFPRDSDANDRRYTALVSELRSDSIKVKLNAIAKIDSLRIQT